MRQYNKNDIALQYFNKHLLMYFILGNKMETCKVGTVSKISDCQPEGPGFNPRLGRGLNFGCPSFATPSVDRDVKPLV